MFNILPDDLSTATAIYTPLEALVSEREARKKEIIELSTLMEMHSQAMTYFCEGVKLEHSSRYFHAAMCSTENAIRALDAAFWSKAMKMTDVLEWMPTDKKNQWHSNIIEAKTPPFERDHVIATMTALMNQRKGFLAERVDGLFRALSGSHVTNRPEGFSARMIIKDVIDKWGSVNSNKASYISDLRIVMAKFTNRGVPKYLETSRDISGIIKHAGYGQWCLFDGGALRLKVFKAGTVHMEIHPDVAWRLNQILAELYPMAIPNQFRSKPKASPKEFPLIGDALPFSDIEALAKARVHSAGRELYFYADNNSLSPLLKQVLENIGGVEIRSGFWRYDYDILPVIQEIIRVGEVPGQKSYQFYPTKPEMALKVVELANITDTCSILEPEAGLAGIAKYLPKDRTTCVEISPIHCQALNGMGYKTHCEDFLQWNTAEKFDRIVMNPPFSEGRAKLHLERAMELLAPGGRLVAILPASMRGKEISNVLHFQWSEVQQDGFDGTKVNVVFLTVDKAPASESTDAAQLMAA